MELNDEQVMKLKLDDPYFHMDKKNRHTNYTL